ncbi:hypothetical protein CBL_07540 [Carabus blaptoides fortunei]
MRRAGHLRALAGHTNNKYYNTDGMLAWSHSDNATHCYSNVPIPIRTFWENGVARHLYYCFYSGHLGQANLLSVNTPLFSVLQVHSLTEVLQRNFVQNTSSTIYYAMYNKIVKRLLEQVGPVLDNERVRPDGHQDIEHTRGIFVIKSAEGSSIHTNGSPRGINKSDAAVALSERQLGMQPDRHQYTGGGHDTGTVWFPAVPLGVARWWQSVKTEARPTGRVMDLIDIVVPCHVLANYYAIYRTRASSDKCQDFRMIYEKNKKLRSNEGPRGPAGTLLTGIHA